MRKITDLEILKAVLMLRRCGNKYQSKEEQIAEQKQWLRDFPEYAEGFDDWVDSMREDLKKTPEQRAAEEEAELQYTIERESEIVRKQEMEMFRNDRDEWDDYWDDAARSVGATRF